MNKVRPWTDHLAHFGEAHVLDLLEGGSLPAVWARHAANEGDQPAIYAEGRWVSRAELESRSRDAASRLHATGIRPTDRVLFSSTPSLDLVVDHLAALRLGAVVVPSNPAYTERELAHIVRDARPSVAFSDSAQRRGAISNADGDVHVVHHSDALPTGPQPPLDVSRPSDPALLPYTSGTTGAPKGVLLNHGNLLAGARALLLAWRWEPDDRLVLSLPLFHMHGLGVGLHGTLAAGASAVLVERFTPEAVVHAADEHHASMFFGVPTMYHRLAASPLSERLSRLRLCVSGSAPLSSDLFDAFFRITGQVILERYGMTETLMNLSNPHDGERRRGTVGFPLPGVEIRFADESPDGSEILLRGPNVFNGYWEQPAATTEAFTSDGWFRTGDIGIADSAGYIRLVGRAKELIITGGYNVFPREVEDVLASCPGVREIAVVGRPSTEWGEVVVAVVVADDSTPTPEQVMAFARERLAPYKLPRIVEYVDALPRNAMGKVMRHELIGEA